MNTYFAIFLGGGLGSISRFGISKLLTSNFQSINPIATLVANVAATIVLGIAIYIMQQKMEISSTMRAMIITGFCGGFSTFSTFSYETYELLRSQNYFFAVANLFISILLGLFALFILARNVME